MALTVEALDRNSRREARHRFSMSSIMLAAMLVLSFVAISSSQPTTVVQPAPSDSRSARLAEQNARQAREINTLRDMFMFCRERGHWSDKECSLPAEQLILTRIDESDSDNGSDSDSSDSDTNQRPSSTSSRGSQRPSQTGTVPRSGGGSDGDGRGDGGGNHGNVGGHDRGSSGKGDPK